MIRMKTAKPLSLRAVALSDPFWSHYRELIRETVIPYQWDALNDRIPGAEPSYSVRNFRIAAGLEKGEFGGLFFQDSDVAKWLEAVGYSLTTDPDPELEKVADAMIDVIEKAQQPDGYLNTYFTLKEPGQRWTNLQECHELYCAGHMMEAACSYYVATGKRKLLDIMCRFADHIDSVFGKEPDKIHGYDGHQEVELALLKLYKVTGNEKYLKLSRYFIDERGKEPNFFINEWETRGKISHWTKAAAPKPDLSYFQAHKPVRQQDTAVGHAVRAVYMYAAMADLAAETGDSELFHACRKIWSNIVGKQMYITGGIGSTRHGEAFTFDFDLPGDTVYAETCASVGLIFFAHRMLQMDLNSTYSDVIETVLYNIIPASIGRDGKSFFYVNPLEVWPEACMRNPDKNHVKPVRQKWFGCACCPPNIARLLASIGQYIYSVKDRTIYIHQYIGGTAMVEAGDDNFIINQENGYPWDGRINISFKSVPTGNFSVALRIPSWCREWTVKLNNCEDKAERTIINGYVILDGNWNQGDLITLELSMPVGILKSNPKVRANSGKVAIRRGPFIYCIEEADNGNNLSAISMPIDAELTADFDESFFGGAITIKGNAFRTEESGWENELYKQGEFREIPIMLKAIPYYLWGNRNSNEMQVWIRSRN